MRHLFYCLLSAVLFLGYLFFYCFDSFKLEEINIKGMLTESDEKLVVLAATNRPQVSIIITRTNMSIRRIAMTAPRVK